MQQAELDPKKLTPVAFYERWGETVSFGRIEVTRALHEANHEYRDLPGHNYDHAKRILWCAMAWADFYEERGMKPDRDVLFLDSLLHDAGIYRDYRELGYLIPEMLSADIFADFGERYGLSPAQIVKGRQAILATADMAKPLTLEDLILVKADLQNVGEDYEASFQPTTELFEAEAKLMASLQGKDFDRDSFIEGSIGRLATYLSNELSLGEYDKEWQERARANVRRLIAETALARNISVPDFLRRLDSSAITKLFEKIKPSKD